MIDQIVQGVNLTRRSPPCSTLDKSKVILQRDFSAPPFKHWFYYIYVIGNTNFLKKSTWGNISYATHQVTQSCKYPCFRHSATIKHLIGYLSGTCNDGLILHPNCAKSFEVYVDADLCENWYRPTPSNDPSTKKSQSGYVLLYEG